MGSSLTVCNEVGILGLNHECVIPKAIETGLIPIGSQCFQCTVQHCIETLDHLLQVALKSEWVGMADNFLRWQCSWLPVPGRPHSAGRVCMTENGQLSRENQAPFGVSINTLLAKRWPLVKERK